MCKAKYYSEQLISLINDVENEYKTLSEQQSKYDLIQEDLLHKIEFDVFDVFQGYNLCKQLQDIRKERRYIKNEVDAINSLRDILNNTKIKNALEKVNNTIVKIEKKKDSRLYTPKILKETS